MRCIDTEVLTLTLVKDHARRVIFAKEEKEFPEAWRNILLGTLLRGSNTIFTFEKITEQLEKLLLYKVMFVIH